MQCVILAGGLGTRLAPLSLSVPKCLVPINGRPFADYQLRWLARQEIDEVVYCVGHLGTQIREEIGDGARYGLRVTYSDEGADLKGTGGALRVAFDNGLVADSFFLLYGDSFLPIAFSPVLAAYRMSGKRALMTVIRNDNRWDTSNAIFEAPHVILYDKRSDPETRSRMKYIDYGLSVISRELVANDIPAGKPVDLAEVFKPMSLSGDLAGFEISERFYEVGSLEGITEFTRFAMQSGL